MLEGFGCVGGQSCRMKPILTIDVGGCFGFSPDGRQIAVAKKAVGKKMGKVLDVATGEEVVFIDRLPANTRYIAYAPNGRFLIFSAAREVISVCDPQSGAIVERIKTGPDVEIRDVALVPDSERFVRVTSAELAEIDIVTGQVIRTLDVGSAVGDQLPRYDFAAFSPDGKYLAVAWNCGVTRRYVSIADWPAVEKVTHVWSRKFDWAQLTSDIKFTPGGGSLVRSANIGIVDLVPIAGTDLDSPPTPWIDRSRPRVGLPGALDLISTSIDFSPDGDLYVYSCRDAFELCRWPSTERLGEWRAPGKNPTIFNAGFSPTGEYLAIAADRATLVYRVADLV